MVRVLIVDNHEPFLQLAHAVVAATPGFEPSHGVTSGGHALSVIDDADLDLVLVDVHMAEMSGIELARRINQEHDGIVVVLMSAEDASDLPEAVNTCGAAEVMRKQDLSPGRLLELWRRLAPRDGASTDCAPAGPGAHPLDRGSASGK